MNGSRYRLAAAVVVAAFSAACAPLRSGGPPRATFPAFDWVPELQPVVSSGGAGWPIMAVDPHVYVDDEGYHLFHTTFFCGLGQSHSYSWDPANPAQCDIMHLVTSIAYAFSADRGLTWEYRQSPVILPADSGFDAGQIETATAFRLGDTLYLAYSADGERRGSEYPRRYQIGLGKVTLGRQSVRDVMMDESRRFERRAEPLLPADRRAGRFDNNVQEPSVVIGPDGVLLYYVALGVRLPDQPMRAPGQGITSIGIGRAVLDERLNVRERSSAPVLEGLNMPEVRYAGNSYQLFATTVTPGANRYESITWASSRDGVQWTAPRVVLRPGSVPGFNDWGLMAPTAAVERNHVVLFVTAFGTVPGDCVLLGNEGRWGLPLRDVARCMYPTIGRAEATLPRPGHPQP